MNKTELIASVAESAGLTKKDTELKLIDYMTAGNDWNNTKFASWLPIK